MYKIYGCPKCEGTGYIIIKNIDYPFRFRRERCSKCGGLGIIKEEIKP